MACLDSSAASNLAAGLMFIGGGIAFAGFSIGRAWIVSSAVKKGQRITLE